MNQAIRLLGPDVPAVGMRSEPDPSVLPPGIWANLENVRCEHGVIQVRDGAVRLLESGPTETGASGTLCGTLSATWNGEATLFAAFRFSTTTRVFRLAETEWIELTDASTRFSLAGDVGIVVVRALDPMTGEPVDVLVIGNGKEDARVWTESHGCAVHSTPAVPSGADQMPYPEGWLVNDSAAWVINSSELGFRADVSAITTLGAGFNFLGEETVEDSAAIIFPHQATIAQGEISSGVPLAKEVVLVLYKDLSSSSSILDGLRKVEVLLGSASDDLSLTAASNASPIVVTTALEHGLENGDLVRISGVAGNSAANGLWSVTRMGPHSFHLNGSVGNGDFAGGGGVDKLSWSTLWDTSADQALLRYALPANVAIPDAEVAVFPVYELETRRWFGIRIQTEKLEGPFVTNHLVLTATSGQLDPQARFALSFASSTSFGEGASALCTRSSGPLLSLAGAKSIGSRYVWDPGSYARTAFRLSLLGRTDLPSNVDLAVSYRSDPYLADDNTLHYGPFYGCGSQGRATLTGGTGKTSFTITSSEPETTREAKEVGHRGLPRGTLFATVNDRLFVAGTEQGSDLWVSMDKEPFAFRQIPSTDDEGKIDSRSANFRSFGGESITAMLPAHGALYGVDELLVWTDRATYRLQGFDANGLTQAGRISEKGTHYRTGIAARDGTVCYLDTEGHIRQIAGSLASNSMSQGRVGDVLDEMELGGACLVAHRGGLRVFVSNNADVLVWQEATGEWVRDIYPFDISAVATLDQRPRRRLFALGANGAVWELEKSGQLTDAGTDIPIRLRTRMLAGSGWDAVSFGRVGVIADALDATLSTQRFGWKSGESDAGVLSLDSSGGSTIWRWDQTVSGGMPSTCATPWCQIELTGALPARTRIRLIQLEMGARSAGADVS